MHRPIKPFFQLINSRRALYLFLCLSFSAQLSAKVQEILHAPALSQLQKQMRNHKSQAFQRMLCEKQLLLKILPHACYTFPDLRKEADSLCLELGIQKVTLSSLQKALTKSLSSSCRKHLKNFEKILLYRKKDAFLEDLYKKWFIKETLNTQIKNHKIQTRSVH